MPGFSKARDFGRIGRDQEGMQELDEMLDDPETSAGELLAALIQNCPADKQEEPHNTLRELSEDRNPHRWAADKLELRRLGKDRRGRDRRMGRDLSAEELTASGPAHGPEDFNRSTSREAQSLDRRRSAHDMAMDSKARRSPALASFRQRYPGAGRIERF